MQIIWWPGYEIQLLGGLQRQQNSAQFCDTLLETEGISVPTHSCLLAALSPYLSQKLSTSPSPPSGQKYHLQLQAVKPHTLLKLVSLLYSGEVEVKGSIEQNDILSAARQFGITGLVERWRDVGMKEGEPLQQNCRSCRGRNDCRKLQDAQIQADMAGTRVADCLFEPGNCVSMATQKEKICEKTVNNSLCHTNQDKSLSREPVSRVTGSVDFSITPQPKSITLDKHFHSKKPSGAPGNQKLNQSSDNTTKPTSTSDCPGDILILPVSHNNNSNYQTPRASESWENTNAETTEGRENTRQPNHTSRGETLGQGKGNSAEKKRVHTHVGRKSLTKMKQMQQMIGTTQISIKVKLRRRTKGEMWEVVRMQEADEALSVLSSLKQMDLTNSDPGPVLPSPHPIVQHVAANPPETSSDPSTTFDSQPRIIECSTSSKNNEPDVLLAQPPGPVEEPDEHLEKLLEDIMIGLNILPNLERDSKTSHHLQTSHDRTSTISQIPGTHCCSAAQTPPSLPSVPSDAVLVQQHHSPQDNLSIFSMGTKDGTSNQSTPLPKYQSCPYPEEPTKSFPPKALCSNGQRLLCQGTSSQDNQEILDFLPLMDGNEELSPQSFPLPCLDDLRLPQCLSPLQPFPFTGKHQLVLNNSMSHGNNNLMQPSPHERTWLTKNSVSLQFPLSAMTHGDSLSLKQDTNQDSCSKQQQKLNKHNKRARPESDCKTEVEVEGTKPASTGEGKSDHRTMKESFTPQQSDTKEAGVAPKRRRKLFISHPVKPSHKLLEVSGGTKSKITLSVCTVSLSCNNVLAKEREKATGSSHVLNMPLRKPDEPTAITETTRGSEDLRANQTRIRTRGFLKKTRDILDNTSLNKSSVSKVRAGRIKTVNKQGVLAPRPKRGRPPKVMPDKSPLVVGEKSSLSVGSKLDVSKDLLKKGDKTERRCKKRRGERRGAGIPLKKPRNINTVEGDAEEITPTVMNIGTRPQMVSLKEFQKRIKCPHSKTRKSPECKDSKTKETAKSVECGEKACKLIKDTDVDTDIAQPQSRTEEPHSVFNVTVDQNHNLVFNKLAAEYSKPKPDNSFAGEETNWFADERHLLISCGVLREKDKLEAEREQSPKNLDEAPRACVGRVSDAAQQTNNDDEGSSHSVATQPPQEKKMPLDQQQNLQTIDRTGPSLSDAAVFIKSSELDLEEEGAEVDILLCSPDEKPESREYEDGLDNMDLGPEEEEEEDVNVTDVTGDEAE